MKSSWLTNPDSPVPPVMIPSSKTGCDSLMAFHSSPNPMC